MQSFKGSILHIGSIKEGKTKDGKDYATLDFVVTQTEGQYPESAVFNTYKTGEYTKHVLDFGKYNKIGDIVEIEYSLKANQYQGKYYNALNAFKINKQSKQEQASSDLPF